MCYKDKDGKWIVAIGNGVYSYDKYFGFWLIMKFSAAPCIFLY